MDSALGRDALRAVEALSARQDQAIAILVDHIKGNISADQAISQLLKVLDVTEAVDERRWADEVIKRLRAHLGPRLA